jgi:hypothetical protein
MGLSETRIECKRFPCGINYLGTGLLRGEADENGAEAIVSRGDPDAGLSC